jgi:hypothetical protein
MQRTDFCAFAFMAAACCSLLVAPAALARPLHASAGYPGSTSAVSCWDNSGAFMTNMCSSQATWVIPVPNNGSGPTGTQVIKLTGQVLTGGTADCRLNAFTATGTMATGYPVSFPTLGTSVGTVQISVQVDPSYFLAIGCVVSGSSKVKLLGIDHP